MKKKVKTLVKIIGIIIAVIALLLLAFIIYSIMTKPKADISDIPQSFGTTLLGNLNNTSESKTKEDVGNLHWYSSVEEAAKDTSLIKDSTYFAGYDTAKRIMDFENEEQYMVINAYENPKNTENDFVSFVLYHKQDGQYSQPYYIFSTWIDLNNDDMYRYDCDDAAASFVALENAMGLTMGKGKKGTVYFGFWSNEAETKSLTFAGQGPDEVKTVNLFDSPYYFWHITLPDTEKRLRSIDYSDYTCQDMIDALEIKYDR